MTEQGAHRKARERSKMRHSTRYVLYTGDDTYGPFDVATEDDLESFYGGISESSVLACYINGQIVD